MPDRWCEGAVVIFDVEAPVIFAEACELAGRGGTGGDTERVMCACRSAEFRERDMDLDERRSRTYSR